MTTTITIESAIAAGACEPMVRELASLLGVESIEPAELVARLLAMPGPDGEDWRGWVARHAPT